MGQDRTARDGDRAGEQAQGPADLVGTPPPPTVSGDQFAGAQTGAQPAEPEEADG